METNDLSGITTFSQLRKARKAISEDIVMLETSLSDRLKGFRKALSMKSILLPAIRKLRKAISGTPFAKP